MEKQYSEEDLEKLLLYSNRNVFPDVYMEPSSYSEEERKILNELLKDVSVNGRETEEVRREVVRGLGEYFLNDKDALRFYFFKYLKQEVEFDVELELEKGYPPFALINRGEYTRFLFFLDKIYKADEMHLGLLGRCG